MWHYCFWQSIRSCVPLFSLCLQSQKEAPVLKVLKVVLTPQLSEYRFYRMCLAQILLSQWELQRCQRCKLRIANFGKYLPLKPEQVRLELE
jgi:hypothetical protein